MRKWDFIVRSSPCSRRAINHFQQQKRKKKKNSADITRILIPLGWAVALMYADTFSHS